MKVSPDLSTSELSQHSAQRYSLPQGLVGLPQHQSFEIVQVPDQEPFLWMKLNGPDPLNFLVLEPTGLIQDYELELFDEDAEFLEIQNSSDASVLNIVTLRNNNPGEATVNLAGPIIINCRTGVAKQCILANYFKYSAYHRLVGETS